MDSTPPTNGEYDDTEIKNEDFPHEESFECWDGKDRDFVISCRLFPEMGFQVEAVEKDKDRMGYVFAAHHPTTPYQALGELRLKISRALSKRHITKKKYPDGSEVYLPLHETVEGRVTAAGLGIPIFVIDGIPLDYQDFLQLFEIHEGWQFRVQFADMSDGF